MDSPSKTVCIIIPIYTNNLKPEERCALKHNIDVLNSYPCIFIYPTGFDIHPLHCEYPNVELLEVSKKWLGSDLGTSGYNKMMTSVSFYKLFKDYEYILICHTDAWIFRDELKTWCDKGYDLIAPPWPTRTRYKYFPLKQYIRFLTILKPKNEISHYAKNGKIGNGGLSLRKVETFRKACIQYEKEIRFYSQTTNEDVFWAVVPHDFYVPSEIEAISFAFDVKPNLMLKMNHNSLPMGCHGFNKPNRKKFWSQFIDCKW